MFSWRWWFNNILPPLAAKFFFFLSLFFSCEKPCALDSGIFMCEGFYLKTEKYIYSVKKLSVCCSLCVKEGCVFGRSVFVVLIQVVFTKNTLPIWVLSVFISNLCFPLATWKMNETITHCISRNLREFILRKGLIHWLDN